MPEKVVKLPEKSDETPVQKLARLDAERAEILASAKSDALQKANDAVTELNALGFHFQLSEGVTKQTTTHAPSDAACPICSFRTTPAHDRRSHRTQGTKAPFTEEELKQRNLVKV